MIYLASAEQDDTNHLHYFYHDGNIFIKSTKGYINYNTVDIVFNYGKMKKISDSDIFIIPNKDEWYMIRKRHELHNIIEEIIFNNI